MTDEVNYSAKHWAKKAEYWAGQAAQGQQQSDWNQSDNTKVDYIKNKPTKLSDFNNDSGFITSSALSGYATQTWVGQQGFLTSSALSGYATETWVGQQGYITSASLPTKLSDLTDDTATTPVARATADASGNTITSTYATKTELAQKSSFKLFHHDWFDYELSDQSWLRADTFSWQDGTVYSNAYNHLVDDIDGKTATSETIAGYTISYYLADDGHKITTDESTVADIYTATGVAWYYVLDTANQRFKLPRTKYGFTGLRDSVGKYVPESLPNIRGRVYGQSTANTGNIDGNAVLEGCFERDSSISNNRNIQSYSTYSSNALKFNANASSSTYQDSAPVQQRATQMYLYFYVGQYTQSAIEQTAGLNAELFNGKVDLDLNNMNPSATAKETIVGWGLPDYSAGVTTLISTSASYTALSAGFITVVKNNTATQMGIKINDVDVQDNWKLNIDGQYLVSEGDVIKTTAGDVNLKFYPLKGV